MNNVIIKEILSQLPEEKISDACFEGANIVLYTKDKDFFLDNNGLIRKIVNNIKKRVELRPDPAITLDIEDAEKLIKNVIPLREIRKKTLWVPLIRRKPAIRSQLIENIRAVLYKNSDYRRKFLDKIGHRIYDGWIREKKNEWIRVSYLGGARQVGRSCLFLQTPESRVLLDCGVNIATDKDAYPYLEAPEFNINDLDALLCY